MRVKWMIALVVVALAIGAWGWWRGGGRRADGIEWDTVRVRRGDIETVVLTTGGVEPQNRVEVKPPIGGRIEDILVREGASVRRGQIVAWMSSTERAALLDAARMKGPEEVARWSELYKPAPLVSPIDGAVIARSVEPGQSVTSADPVVVLSDRLIVKAQVDETDIGAVQVGQAASVVLDAYPQHSIAAVVDHIAYEAQTVNNVTVYAVDVLPGDVPPFMRSGMTANVTFKVAAKSGVLLVPAESVRDRDGDRWVLLPAPGGRDPDRRPVSTGLTDGKRTEIVSGLAEGQEILVARSRLPDRASQAPTNPFSPFGQRRSSRRE